MRATREDLLSRGMEKEADLPRKARRGYVLDKPAIRSGSRTGTTSHFAAWKAEGRIKSTLQKLKLDKLAAALDGPEGQAFGILYTASAGRYRSVWDVKAATRSELLAVDGIGPARLEHIASYLTARGVALDWAA